jgi:hypothetical protein
MSGTGSRLAHSSRGPAEPTNVEGAVMTLEYHSARRPGGKRSPTCLVCRSPLELREIAMRRVARIALSLAVLALGIAAPVGAQNGQQLFMSGVSGSGLGGCANSGCHNPTPSRDAPLPGESLPRVLKIVQPDILPGDRISVLRNWAFRDTGMKMVVDSFNDANTGGRGDQYLQAVIDYLATFVSAPPPGTLTMPSPIEFGSQAVGTASLAAAATISNASSTAVAIASVASDNTDFAIASDTCSGRTINPGASCQVSFFFQPRAAGNRSATVTVTTGSGKLYAFLLFGTGQAVAGGANYTGLYWNAPANSESGWGINVAHQGDIVFMTWFTYDATGRDWWLIMVGSRTAEGVFSGQLREATGPPFNTVPFNPTGQDPPQTVVGSATLDFTAAGGPTFTFTVNGTTRTRNIVLQQFAAAVPTCAFGAGNQAAATNYTDLWWAAPARSENGWGINLTHQGDVVFGTWFTYGVDGRPMWLFVIAGKTGVGSYSGKVYRSTGTPYNAPTYAGFSYPDAGIGTMTLTFADGANGSMSYAIGGIAATTVTQTKAIVRQTLVSPGITCR